MSDSTGWHEPFGEYTFLGRKWEHRSDSEFTSFNLVIRSSKVKRPATFHVSPSVISLLNSRPMFQASIFLWIVRQQRIDLESTGNRLYSSFAREPIFQLCSREYGARYCIIFEGCRTCLQVWWPPWSSPLFSSTSAIAATVALLLPWLLPLGGLLPGWRCTGWFCHCFGCATALALLDLILQGSKLLPSVSTPPSASFHWFSLYQGQDFLLSLVAFFVACLDDGRVHFLVHFLCRCIF